MLIFTGAGFSVQLHRCSTEVADQDIEDLIQHPTVPLLLVQSQDLGLFEDQLAVDDEGEEFGDRKAEVQVDLLRRIRCSFD